LTEQEGKAGMGAFRRVEGGQAGPAALGILIPPGRRTFVILRPRALPWDLLLLRGGADGAFRELAHDEASAAAQSLYRALREAAGGPGRAEVVVERLAVAGCRVRATVGPFPLLACPRVPGQPYQALVCADQGAAQAVADALGAVLSPPEGVEQEVYFNTRFFDLP
jgi:hypothetical protein